VTLVGSSAAGLTTLARFLAQKYQMTVIDVDELARAWDAEQWRKAQEELKAKKGKKEPKKEEVEEKEAPVRPPVF
jgi:adenylate kinase family enzyme